MTLYDLCFSKISVFTDWQLQWAETWGHLGEYYNNPRNAWIRTRVWSQMVKYRICFEGRVNRTCAMMEYEEHGRNSNDIKFSVSQFSSVAQSCLTLCNPMNRSTPGLPVHHQLPEFTQTHVHRVRDAIQTSHPRSSPSPPAPNPSQHQSLFQWVRSSHEVAKVLELQL